MKINGILVSIKYAGGHRMQYQKPFHTLDEQIEKLSHRGLIITDTEEAKRQLLKTSYYDLINGYKDLFLEKDKEENSDEVYIKGSKFEDLVRLHQLDRDLRHIVMRVTLDVESNFYTTLAYCIAEKYGDTQESYLNIRNYRRGKKQGHTNYERDVLFRKINKRIREANDHPMKHYKTKYKNIPPWILAKHMSFGELIMWYKLSPQDVKSLVVKRFTDKDPTDQMKEAFLKSMELFNKFRNRAAHGGRIYNYKTNIEIPYNENLHKIFYIDKEDHNKGIGRSDFSAFILSRLYLKENDKWEYIEKIVYLNGALEDYQKESPKHYNEVLKMMGLPVSYNERLLKIILI